jgi:hypothetical protein
MNGLTLPDARDGGELALDQVLSDHSESHAMRLFTDEGVEVVGASLPG